MWSLLFLIFRIVVGDHYTGKIQECNVSRARNLEMSLSFEDSSSFTLTRVYNNTSSSTSKESKTFRGSFEKKEDILILRIQGMLDDSLCFKIDGDTLRVEKFNLITAYKGLEVKSFFKDK